MCHTANRYICLPVLQHNRFYLFCFMIFSCSESKDLRKLQQNLFYKQPECFVNDQIQRKK